MRYINLIRQFKNWPQYFSHKWGNRSRDLLIFNMRSGVSVEVPAQLMVEFKEVFFSMVYGRHLGVVKRVDTILDIGANVGFFTTFAASQFPEARIFAYEPVPANFLQLQANISRNPGTKAELHNQAVAAQKGQFTMELNDASQFTTSASIVTGKGGKTISVDCVGFDSVISELPGGRCDFLKMDCEGAEYDILFNSSPEILGKIGHIAMECHHLDDARQNAEAMVAYLKEHGFSVHLHGNMVYGNKLSNVVRQ